MIFSSASLQVKSSGVKGTSSLATAITCSTRNNMMKQHLTNKTSLKPYDITSSSSSSCSSSHRENMLDHNNNNCSNKHSPRNMQTSTSATSRETLDVIKGKRKIVRLYLNHGFDCIIELHQRFFTQLKRKM